MKLIKYAEEECQAWFTANVATIDVHLEHVMPLQVLCFESICLVDGSWTSIWIDMIDGDWWTQLLGIRNIRRRESLLHMELEASHWDMDSMLHHSTCQHFGTDCKDVIAIVGDLDSWSSFLTELKELQYSLRTYFKISKSPIFKVTEWNCISFR